MHEEAIRSHSRLDLSQFIGVHCGLMVSVTFHIIVICHDYLNLIAVRFNSVKFVRTVPIAVREKRVRLL